MFQAKLLDYFRSGYGECSSLRWPASERGTDLSTLALFPPVGTDRGHMVPAADAKQSQQAMSETFLLSNIAPQVGDGFNRHYWAYLEAVRPGSCDRSVVWWHHRRINPHTKRGLEVIGHDC